MNTEVAIKKLHVANQGLRLIRDNVHEQLTDLRSDPKLDGLVDDLENLFESYFATWMRSNSEILNILKKGNQTCQL